MEERNISNPFGNAPVYYVDQTESTMDDLRRIWRVGEQSGVVLAAGFQRSGRGRIATRRWVSPPGSGLLFSLALAVSDMSVAGSAGAAAIPADLPLRVGCAIAVFLRRFGLAGTVKWPNDVMVGGRKIAGVLVETIFGGAVIGVGLNCNQTALPESVAATATSLRRETGRPVEPLELLPGMLTALKRYIDGSRRRHLAPLLWGVGSEISVRIGDSTLFGRLVETAPAGGMVVRTASGLRTVTSGEIVRME